MNVLDVLEQRGFVHQVTAEDPEEREALRVLLEKPTTCYIGFDPTSASLHAGSLVPIMALVHMQRCGHRPIALVGGGTGLIGDPSGKTEMRKLLSREEIDSNAEGLKKQLARFLSFEEGRALLLNNAQWLTKLNYIEFLRDFGKYFSVNRMLTAESIRRGLERGLSFIEFNYMLLQAYDFWYLFVNHDCTIQMGGSDQWGNIVAGIELIRKMEAGKKAYGITFPLLETSSGRKMGKTEKGTVWLDPQRTPSYQYYQFWINTEDADLVRFLKLFTLLPLDEILEVEGLEGSALNPAKAVLAYEATKLAHGEEAALEAHRASGVFGAREIPAELLPTSTVPRRPEVDFSSIPTTELSEDRLTQGIPACELLVEVGLCSSRGEARRLIAQGGAYRGEQRISSAEERIFLEQMGPHGLLLRKGKKRYHRVTVGRKKNSV